MITKFLSNAETQQLGPRQVRVIASTQSVDRAGDIVVQAGIDLGDFLANPIILYQHDPNTPVGRASDVQLTAAGLAMTINFADAGVSAKADEVCGLVKSGILRGISIGFAPLVAEPIDKKKPSAGQRYTQSALMEVSVVSIPANTDAAVVARAAGVSKLGARISAETAAALRQANEHHAAGSSIIDGLLAGGEQTAGASSQAERMATVERLRGHDFATRKAKFAELRAGNGTSDTLSRESRPAAFEKLRAKNP
ncbi:HK97 family phage prohead protease [Acidocella facilis]|uniref:HK97 family phage prohead protease n=1 Tax=Acidocella facilis TaxID=525 RepID=UPI00047B1E89|nr:HK97 family phage prohead protease [Acidocella facilis]